MTRRLCTVALLMATVLAAVSPASAAPASIDAKRREASRLQSQIAEQGRKLSIASEEYDAVRIEREKIDGKIVRARKDLQIAEDRWSELKERLGRRVRFLYMHPGIWAAPLLDAHALGDIARGRVLAGSVLMMDTGLILDTERARADIEGRKAELEGIRADAKRKESVMAAKQADVQKQLSAQRALLSQVQGEIAQLIAEERKRQLAEAAKRAATAGPRTFGVPAPRNVGPVRPAAAKAIAVAAAQIGKPYEWGADGPATFDCSGLTAYAWSAAGVMIPHSSGAQYASLAHVANDQIAPGDLLFFGSPIHHVGIYEGGGVMINAPETGENVRRDSIYRRDFVGAARP